MSDTRIFYPQPVNAHDFAWHLNSARGLSSRIDAATSDIDPDIEPAGTRYYLDHVNGAGFAIRKDGELVFVHSLTRGLGAALVEVAIRAGATRLDCFDGYLVDLYSAHGFVETSREPNWTPGGPDVVFMAQPEAVAA